MSVPTPSPRQVAADMIALTPLLRKFFVRPVERLKTHVKLPVTPSQLFTLAFIRQAGSALSMAQLAKEMEVSKQQLTKIVANLLKQGLILRRMDARGYRTLEMRLTESGEALFARFREALVSAIEPRLERLRQEGDADFEELAGAVATLRRLLPKL